MSRVQITPPPITRQGAQGSFQDGSVVGDCREWNLHNLERIENMSEKPRNGQRWAPLPMPSVDELLSNTTRDSETGCMTWNGARANKCGYGVLHRRPKQYMLHRLVWELLNGPIPDGMRVCHKCDNRPCCNPDHLFLGTQKDNIHDCITKGRFTQWNSSMRLSDSDIADIRSRIAVETGRVLAAEYGISPQHISNIKNMKRRTGRRFCEPAK